MHERYSYQLVRQYNVGLQRAHTDCTVSVKRTRLTQIEENRHSSSKIASYRK